MSQHECGSEQTMIGTLYNEEVTCQVKLTYGWIYRHRFRVKSFIYHHHTLTFAASSIIRANKSSFETTFPSAVTMSPDCWTTLTAVSMTWMGSDSGNFAMSLRSISRQAFETAVEPDWVGSLVLSRTAITPLILSSALPSINRNSKALSVEEVINVTPWRKHI